MSQLGRISGPLLKANLLRQGVDLAFETDLLYLDVVNRRIGIKTATPSHELQVVGTTRTTDLEVTGSTAQIGDFLFSPNTITYDGDLTFNLPEGSALRTSKFSIDSIDIFNNIIATNESNANLELRPSGTGIVDIKSGVQVAGDLQVDGAITADGNIQLGDAITDTVVFNAEINSDLIPDANETYRIGSNPATGGKRWYDTWTRNLYADIITSQNLIIDGVNISALPGNMLYVSAVNGDDTRQGEHPNDTLKTLKQALSLATAGTTIYLYPGVYEEEFPLEIPVGVTVKGTGIRSVRIVPTTQTEYNDAFLLNGETTVEDLTVADFYSGGNYFTVTSASAGTTTVNVGTSPFAHTYVSGGTIEFIDSSSGTITGATYTHTTGTLVLTHTGGTASPGDRVFLSNLTFSCNGGNRIFPDNGYAFRFATDFEVTTRSPYIRNITVLTKGTNVGIGDPLGFGSGDAGKGAYVDGAYATALSKEASMLFHSVTFITPGVDGLSATNGARIEWLNSFTYYANKGMNLFSSNDGFNSDGKTRIKISNRTGTFNVGNTLSYYDTDGTTVLASGTIQSIDGDFFNIDGKSAGWVTLDDRVGKTVTVSGNAKLSTAQKKFGSASLVLDGTGDFINIASQPDFNFNLASRLEKTLTLSGNTVVSTIQSKFNGGSILFDGTGDKLTVASSSDFAFGTGDFTAEAWIYRNVIGTNCIFDFRTASAGNQGILLFTNNTLQYSVNGSVRISVSVAGTSGTWTHIALVRSAGTTTLYANGSAVGTPYVDGYSYVASTVTIGAYYNNVTYFNGYIDEVRISNSARYTGTFTPSTSPFVHDNNSKLLIHGDTDISDDGGSGNFTIEGWIYRTTSGSFQVLYDMRTAATDIAIAVGISNLDQLYCFINGSIVISGATTVPLNSWSHVAISRSETSLKLFLNGVQQGSTYTDTNTYNARPFRVGADYTGSFAFTGFIDEVRVIKGISVYTSNFTAPTVAFTSNSSTVLLLHFNGTNNSTIIVDDGVTTQDIRTSAGGTATVIDLADYSDFGAELRSIGSACVYGNYGAYGDGDGVIAYLIGQNLAYIGNGGDSNNDPTTVIQANEVVELNRAKIFYTSVDHKGDFRVGDQFYINQDTGEVIFSNSNIAVTGSLLFNDGVNQTYIDATKIETGDFRISNNTVETLSQVMNINSFTGEVNFLNNVNVAGDLDVTGNVTIGGNITIGDQTTDSVNIEARINSDIIPKINDTYDLGTTVERWRQIFVNRLTADNIEIVDNKISTLDSNSDLELSAAGTGKVLIPNNDLQVNDTFTVIGTTNLQNTNITGSLTLTGNANITGDVVQTGDLSVSGSFFSASLDLENIEIVQNNIRTKNSNQDLQLEAAGTGRIYVPSNDVQIDQDLTVSGTITGVTITNSGTVTSNTFTNNNIVISTNTIATTVSNSDLELRSNGTGKIYVSASDVQIDEDLDVLGVTNLAATNVSGTLTVNGNIIQTGNYTQTGDLTITGNLSVSNAAQFENILIDDNFITTTQSNSDLELRAAGTGKVIIDDADLQVLGNLDVVNNIATNTLTVSTDITADRYTNGNILIENNVISTTISNSDLEIRANGSGIVQITSDTNIDQDLTVSGVTTLLGSTNDITGIVSHIGNYTQSGTATHNGDYNLTGNLTVSSYAQFEDIRIDGNQLRTTDSNSDLELSASGLGIVVIPNNDVTISQNLTVNGTLTVENLSLSILETEIVQTSDIRIQNNFITTTLSNSDLELRANGTGKVVVPDADVEIQNDFTVQGVTDLQTTNITGTVTQVGNTVHTGNTTQTGDYTLNGNLSVSGLAEIADIQINGNQISSTNGLNLVLDAPGSGIIYVPENDVLIENDLFVNGTLYANNVIGTFGSLQSNEIDTGDIVVRGNRITTTQSNSDLELRANGTGSVVIDSTDLIVNGGLIVTTDVQLNNTQITGTLTHNGTANHTGTVNQTGAYNLTGNMNITGTAQFSNIRVEGNVIRTTTPGSDLTFQATGGGIVTVPFNDVEITQNLTVSGDVTTTDIVASGSVTAPVINLGSITISGNLITTNTSNTNLELRANGTGGIELESVIVNQNQISTLTNTDLIIAPNGTGIADFQGTQAIRLPRGTAAQRPAGQVGQIRYNTDSNYYEGYDGSNWRRLDGVYDLDENTYITAETTPGANDNVISFYINGLNRATLNASNFSTTNVDIGNINITGNTVSTTNANGNLVLAPNGLGSTVIGVFAIRNNSITNTLNDAITSFNQTGTGYFKIDGTNGFVIPRGTDVQRGVIFETGMMRYNTTDQRVEVYDGVTWVSAAGSSGTGITYSEAEGLAITTALIFG